MNLDWISKLDCPYDVLDEGRIVLINGDCLKVLPLMPKGCVDAVVTSPPYGNIRTYGSDIRSSVDGVIAPLAASVSNGGVIVWNEADQTIDGSESCDSFRHALAFRGEGMRLHDTMIYCKEAVTFPDSNRYHPAFEYMFVFSHGAPAHFNGLKDRKNKWAGDTVHGSRREANGMLLPPNNFGKAIPPFGLRWNWWVMKTASQEESIDHPARMPFQMARDHILTWTSDGCSVLDPFLGSGTTLVACIRTGRQGIGIEISSAYYAIAKRRIENELRQPRLPFAEPAKAEQQELFNPTLKTGGVP